MSLRQLVTDTANKGKAVCRDSVTVTLTYLHTLFAQAHANTEHIKMPKRTQCRILILMRFRSDL